MSKTRLSTDKVLSDDHYKAIGKIAVEWTYVELDVEVILWHVANIVDDTKSAHAITAHLGSETRLDILKTLVHNKVGDCPEYRELCAFLDGEFKALRTARNEIIHGLYYLDASYPGSASLYQVKAKGRLKMNFVQRTVSELELIAIQMAGLREKLDCLAVWRKALPSKYVGPHR